MGNPRIKEQLIRSSMAPDVVGRPNPFDDLRRRRHMFEFQRFLAPTKSPEAPSSSKTKQGSTGKQGLQNWPLPQFHSWEQEASIAAL